MNSINLLPAAYIAASIARRRLRTWTLASSAYAVVLCLGALIAIAQRGSAGEQFEVQTSARQIELESLGGKIRTVRQELSAISAELAAARAIGVHPDWSRLLDVLAAQRTDRVVLESVDLRTVNVTSDPKQANAAGKPKAESKLMLELSGLARSLSDVSNYQLALESTKLFSRVALVESGPRAKSGARAIDATAFKISAELDGRSTEEGRP